MATFAVPGAKLSPQLFDTFEFGKMDKFLLFVFFGETDPR